MTEEEKREIIHACVEQLLLLLPAVMNRLIKQAAAMRTASDKFYQDNSDLAGERELVAKTIEQLEAAHPDKSLDDLMSMAAVQARNSLRAMKSLGQLPTVSADLKRLDQSLGKL